MAIGDGYVYLMISIHALREEGDPRGLVLLTARPGISIHALREEGDLDARSGLCDLLSISIHALREEGDASCMV